jgi:small redox-active disulfide protein 2
MKIIIYGGGCKSCKKLYDNVLKAISFTKINADVEYNTDMNAIVQKGFMMLPVLEVDGIIIAKGRVLSDKEISEILLK